MKGKMKLNNTSKFDIDLKYGQVREKRVAELLSNDKVEIKTERSWWRKTGNIAIEYEYRGNLVVLIRQMLSGGFIFLNKRRKNIVC